MRLTTNGVSPLGVHQSSDLARGLSDPFRAAWAFSQQWVPNARRCVPVQHVFGHGLTCKRISLVEREAQLFAEGLFGEPKGRRRICWRFSWRAVLLLHRKYQTWSTRPISAAPDELARERNLCTCFTGKGARRGHHGGRVNQAHVNARGSEAGVCSGAGKNARRDALATPTIARLPALVFSTGSLTRWLPVQFWGNDP